MLESALRGVVIGIRTVEQARHERLHAVSLKAILQRRKRHYSLLVKGKVANYQRIIVRTSSRLDVRHAAVVDGLLRIISAAQQVEEWGALETKKGVTITRNALI